MGFFGRSLDLVDRFPDFLPLAWFWLLMWWGGLELWLRSRFFRTLAFAFFPMMAGRRWRRMLLLKELFGFDWRRWSWKWRFVVNVVIPGGALTILVGLRMLGW